MPVRRREHFVFLEKPAFFPLGMADGRGGGLETVGGKEGRNILSEYMADEKLSITTVIILYWFLLDGRGQHYIRESLIYTTALIKG